MSLTAVLYLALAMFSLGLYGVLARRHVVAVLLSIELMFNAANLAIAALSWSRGLLSGVVLVLFSIAITVAEVAVGLSLVLLAARRGNTTVLDDLSELKG